MLNSVSVVITTLDPFRGAGGPVEPGSFSVSGPRLGPAGKLANLPEGCRSRAAGSRVRFDGAENALERLFALAQALGNDYVRFEELVGRGAGGG